MSSHPKYAPLLSERSSLDSVHPDFEREKPIWRRASSHALFHWLAHILSVVMIFGLVLATNKLYTFKGCLTHFNAYSPLLDALNPSSYTSTKFIYSLWSLSPTKGPPTPAVQDAWHEAMEYGEIAVSADVITRIGHNLSSVQYPGSVRTSPASARYPVIASGTHALHCLHFIWQEFYISNPAADPGLRNATNITITDLPSSSSDHQQSDPKLAAQASSKRDVPRMYTLHYEHCVDYLRQYIQCKFDTTVLPLVWVREHQQPTPNGNTWHKCVDWSVMQSWLADRQVEMPEGFEWRQPEDAVRLEEDP